VYKTVDVSRRKHKTAAELKWIFAQAVLADANGFGAFARTCVISTKEMQQVGFLEANGAIRFALIINEKREGNASLLAEMAGITRIAEADGSQMRAFFAKLLFEFAQLRDVLTAENSTVMAKKDDDRRRIAPQGTQPYRFSVDIRQRDAGEFRAVTLSHGASFSWADAHLSRLNQHSFVAAIGGRVACLQTRGVA
jgi:hypothetical protein